MLTMRAFRVINKADKEAARAALRAAGIPATVRSGGKSSATRWTLTVTTKTRTMQGTIDAVITPLGFEVDIAANHMTTQFFYRVQDGKKIRNPGNDT